MDSRLKINRTIDIRYEYTSLLSAHWLEKLDEKRWNIYNLLAKSASGKVLPVQHHCLLNLYWRYHFICEMYNSNMLLNPSQVHLYRFISIHLNSCYFHDFFFGVFKLCLEIHDLSCSAIWYDRSKKLCVVTSTVMEKPDSFVPTCSQVKFEYYRRNRCKG